jgi:hypothetical protein
MALCLLLFPVAVLLGIGLPNFPLVTGLFLGYLVALGVFVVLRGDESTPEETL